VLFDVSFLFGAGFLGGVLNSVAGGGSFITFPALLLVGVDPVSANATGHRGGRGGTGREA